MEILRINRNSQFWPRIWIAKTNCLIQSANMKIRWKQRFIFFLSWLNSSLSKWTLRINFSELKVEVSGIQSLLFFLWKKFLWIFLVYCIQIVIYRFKAYPKQLNQSIWRQNHKITWKFFHNWWKLNQKFSRYKKFDYSSIIRSLVQYYSNNRFSKKSINSTPLILPYVVVPRTVFSTLQSRSEISLTPFEFFIYFFSVNYQWRLFYSLSKRHFCCRFALSSYFILLWSVFSIFQNVVFQKTDFRAWFLWSFPR